MTSDDLIRLADDYRHKAQDYCDDPGNSQVQQFRAAAQDFYDKAKAHKDPDYLFTESKNIENMVQGFKNTTGTYSPMHVDDMYDRSKDIQNALRELSNSD